jgi:hypothetical protein
VHTTTGTARIDMDAPSSRGWKNPRMAEVVTTGSTVRVLPSAQPEGLISTTRRVSELGVGAASISVRAVLDALDRYFPSRPVDRRGDPSVVRDLSRAATGMALAAEQRALDVAEAVEITTQRAVEVGRQVPVVRDVLAGFGSFVGRWATRGEVEQARRRAETTAFLARLVPAVLDAVLERVDVAAIVARVPLEDIVGAIDVDAVLDRIDIDALLAHIDVDRLLERIDVESVVDRVNADALVQRVNVAAILDRVDMAGVVGEVLDEVDIGSIVRDSTGSITSDAVDGARLTAMRLDGFVGRVADRVLLRRHSDRTGLASQPDFTAPEDDAEDDASFDPAGPDEAAS